MHPQPGEVKKPVVCWIILGGSIGENGEDYGFSSDLGKFQCLDRITSGVKYLKEDYIPNFKK